MATPIQLIVPADAGDIVVGEALPYHIYLPNGIPLAPRGAVFRNLDQLEILRRQGWRAVSAEENPPANARALEEAADDMERLPEARLQHRERVPLSEAAALIADDMTLSLKLLMRMLREYRLGRIIETTNGRQAVTQFFRQRPDLVFLDIDMPVLDGIDALKQIKSWSPETFVCLVSGCATLVNVKVAKQHGVDAFLVKPISGLNLQRILSLYTGPTGVEA